MKRTALRVALLVGVTLLLGARDAPAGSPQHATTDRDVRYTCDRVLDPSTWDATLDLAFRVTNRASRVDPLVAAPRRSDWTVLDVSEVADLDAYARTSLRTGTVRVSPLTPCHLLFAVVVHESAHVAQWRAGLTPAGYRADARRFELDADRATRRHVWWGLAYAPYLAGHPVHS